MNTSTPKPDPGAKAPPMMHEGDIGSGEITPGQHETNEMIKEIPPLPRSGGNLQQGGKQDGVQDGVQDGQQSGQDAGQAGNRQGGSGQA